MHYARDARCGEQVRGQGAKQQTLRGSYVSAIVDIIMQWCALNSVEYSYRGVVEFRASKEVSTEV